MTAENHGDNLKEILRRYPTGVTVVTSLLDGKPWGGTMNSFTSVSIDPPLVALFIIDRSRTNKALNQTGKYVINIMKHDQEDTARQFANDGMEDKFAGIEYTTNADGIPLVSGSLGYIQCEVHSTQAIADHVLFIGKVTGVSLENDNEALIYYKRAFRSFQ